MYSFNSTVSDILRQGVDSLAQWLEYLIFVQVVMGSKSIRDIDFLSYASSHSNELMTQPYTCL